MNNRYFKLIQLSPHWLSITFIISLEMKINTSDIDLKIGPNSLLIITLFFFGK